MMKTSYTQFKILVEFMERYGDLSRPPSGPYGRYWFSAKWLELTAKLNRECTGGRSRSEDKWRKVWSDFKNNIKRKRAKINKLQGCNNGRAQKTSLTEIEQRVMRIIASKKTPQVDVAEIGLDLNEILLETDIKVESLKEINTRNSEVLDLDDIQDSEVPEADSFQYVEVMESDVRGTKATEKHVPNIEAPEYINDSECPQLYSVIKGEPSPPNNKTKYKDKGLDVLNERSDPSSSPSTSYDLPPLNKRRKVGTKTESKVDHFARTFMESDQNIREFLRERERERVRQRDIELQLQDRWIDTVQQGLNIFKMFVEKWMK